MKNFVLIKFLIQQNLFQNNLEFVKTKSFLLFLKQRLELKWGGGLSIPAYRLF